MPIAFSNTDIVYNPSVAVSTSADLRNAIDAVLIAADWTAADYGDGRLYQCMSPQGYEMQLYVYDDGVYDGAASTGNYVKLQVRSVGDGAPVSQIHQLGYTARTYSLWANCCQLFIWIPGVYFTPMMPDPPAVPNRWTYYYHNFQCGIPRVPGAFVPGAPGSPCSVDGASSVSGIWWVCSCGTWAQNSIYGESLTFRNSHSTYEFWTGSESPYFDAFDAALFSSSAYAAATWPKQRTALRLLPIVPPTNTVHFLWIGRPPLLGDVTKPETFLKYDPFIGWGSGPDAGSLSIRGQLWDSILISTMRDLDEDLEVNGVDDFGAPIKFPFHVYGHGQRVTDADPDTAQVWNATERQIYGASLALLSGPPVGTSTAAKLNYAY